MKMSPVKMILPYMICFLLISSFSSYSNSYFTMRNNSLGERGFFTTVRGIGMGGTGLAAFDSVAIVYNTVSTWRFINDTRVSFAMKYQWNNTDVDGKKTSNASANFSALNFAVPIQKKRWVIGISLQPYTSVNGVVSTELAGSQTVQKNELRGTISQAQLHLVWSPGPSVGFALNGGAYFGAIDDSSEFVSDPLGFRVGHKTIYQFSGASIGMSMDFQPIRDRLLLAGFVEINPALKVKRKYTSQVNVPEPAATYQLDKFPLQFGIGSAYRLGSRLNVALDFSAQQWHKLFKGSVADSVADLYRVGIGLERSMLNKYSRRFWEKIALRGGVSTRSLGYKFNNEAVVEYALHAGMGIPFGGSNSRFDVGVKAGMRGDRNKNLAEETFVDVVVSVAMGEKWFQKFRP